VSDEKTQEFELAPEELLVAPPTDFLTRRREAIDEKQALVARILLEMGCEGAVLLVPAHVAWYTAGINIRGLFADGERPGIYTNGRQRWVICSNIDSQRIFDEELDQLGFMLKEWQWPSGRASLLGELVANRKTASDRPFPNLQLINERLRSEIRPLAAAERERYRELGKIVSHAVEAAARTFNRGDTEAEVAGQVAHRLHRHVTEVVSISVSSNGRAGKYRRAGFTETPITSFCVIQATGSRDGLFATVGRTVAFWPVQDELRREHDLATKLAAVYQSRSRTGDTIGAAGELGRLLTANGPFEYEWRHSQPGYGTGWLPAEELRRMGQDEPFVANQAIVWQAKVGATAVVDTVLITEEGASVVTPLDLWPFKRIKYRERSYDVADLLVREV